jgi:NAD(P)-dependent dehydrogenase (short-subunit alcohol dehydrogenase family)
MRRLQDRTTLVIGADAIGRGIAIRFAQEGARLAVADADLVRAQAVAAEIPGALALGIDPDDAKSFAAAAARTTEAFGGLHVLANNPLPPVAVAPLEDQDFAPALAAVRAAGLAMQAAFPFMREAGWGRIVNVGHRYGETVGEAIGAYNTAAWALVGLTRTAALDWGRWGIATNLLLPFAQTPELAAALERRPRVLETLIGQLPLRRAGDPVEDVGAAAVFLACDEANFINGQVVHADGGLHVAGPPLNPARFG